MSRYDTMINHFNCGCVLVGDVPTITRCEEHNGFIVTSHNQNVPERRFSNEHGTVWQGTLLHSLRKIKDECFSYVYAYPEHHVLNAFNWLRPDAWRNKQMEEMRHLQRILKPGGYITFVVDPSVSHTVIYQAYRLGMTVEVRDCVTERFDPPKFSELSYATADAKVQLLVYNGHRDKIPEKGGRVLDISGMKLDKILKRKKKNSLLVLAGHPYQFDIVKKRLEAL
uniref:Uncharacterized protein n=1 Tax=Pseudomonas phage HRDY3 TaxID=3236930 RepID=A0AB39CE26_9VIRU